VQHAQSMIISEERKAAAQLARYKRRLATLEVESDRLRVSVMEAEAQVKAMTWSNEKVRFRVWLMVWVRVRVRLRVRVRVRVKVHRSLFRFAHGQIKSKDTREGLMEHLTPTLTSNLALTRTQPD
jgi:hypothetical protein